MTISSEDLVFQYMQGDDLALAALEDYYKEFTDLDHKRIDDVIRFSKAYRLTYLENKQKVLDYCVGSILFDCIPENPTWYMRVLLGRTMVSVENLDTKLIFTADTGEKYIFSDNADCGCGNDVSVTIEDICGDLNHLVGSPILMSEEVSNYKGRNSSGTWTFYKFATAKGYVTVRWYGTSNGYYGECVDFYMTKDKK